LGLPASFVTVLPDKNPVADAVVGELRRFGVDTSRIVRGKGRMGAYYVEAGANQRPSKVAYDREYSAIALAKPGDINWDRALEDAGWFHVTGITPAISSSAAELALQAVQKARAKLFGAWEMNWMAYNYAHDVKLPGSPEGPVAFLMYPQAETGDSRRDSLDPEQFRYTIKSREIAF
jgi:hypothetical protein